MAKAFQAVAFAGLLLAAGFFSGAAQVQAAPKYCATPEYRQFDFWLGDWNVTNPAGKLAGTNNVTLIEDGCVLQEHWQSAGGSAGTSFNLYNAATKQWHQTWVDNSGGLLLLDGGLSNGAMVLTQNRRLPDGSAALERITWTPLASDRVRQLWDRSMDGGKHWRVIFDGIYTRKR
jgi:hypothetical protein